MFILSPYQEAYSIALPFSLTFPAPHHPLRSKPALYKNPSFCQPLFHILPPQPNLTPFFSKSSFRSSKAYKILDFPSEDHPTPTPTPPPTNHQPPHRLTSPYADHVHQRHLDVLLRQRQHRGALPGEMSRVPAYQVFRVQGRETRCVAAGCSQVEPSFV